MLRKDRSSGEVSSFKALPNLFLASALVLASATLALGQATPPAGPPGQGGPPRQPPPPPTAGMHLEIIPEGSSGSYRVTEQLVGVSFPNDAVGTSTTVAGTLVIAPDGSIPAGSSKLTIDLRNMKSDQDMRDGFVANRTLEISKYPLAEFVPTKITGLPAMIPTTGQAGIELTGNMTIHGVTKELKFQGIATFSPRDSTVSGRASTNFTFETFGLTKPAIGRLVSVDDKITLDVVFHFKRT